MRSSFVRWVFLLFCVVSAVSALSDSASAASYRKYYFLIRAPELHEIQEVLNCVMYEALSYWYTDMITGKPGNYRFHLRLYLKRSALNALLKGCPWGAFSANVTLQDETAHPPKEIPVPRTQLSETEMGRYLARRNPAIPPVLTDEERHVALKEIQAFLAIPDYQAAIHAAVKAFRFDLFDYSASYDPALGAFQGVVDHPIKTIRLGKHWFTSPCRLLIALRHEGEHVRQIKQANYCEEKAETCSWFRASNAHGLRERAAYLNDIRSILLFCTDSKEISDSESDTWAEFHRYLPAALWAIPK